MQCLWPLIFLCIEVLGNYRYAAVSPEYDEKPSASKAKLVRQSFADQIKKSKSVNPGLGRLESLKSNPELLNWDTAGLDVTPPPEYQNDTVEIDSHTYYNSTFYASSRAKDFWVDVDSFPTEQVITHAMLSDSHRQATTIEMSFDFPFYGSKLRNITIATGGFLYMGTYLHNWIAATQYIAPLMANFDTTLSDNSTIKYADNGTMFTVQWDHVFIQDKHNRSFTFQANLFKTGDISFVYKEIPFPVTEISEDQHPVKVGLSDAYILERVIFFVRRKTIYEYHKVDMMQKSISNNTAIYFTALPTCLDYMDCGSCMAAAETLECTWCNAVQRCSDGVDRLRQNWVAADCQLQRQVTCPVVPSQQSQDIYINTSPVQNAPVITSSSTPAHPGLGTSTTPPVIAVTSTSRDISSDIRVSTRTQENPEFNVTAHSYTQEKIEEKLSVSISTGAVITIVVFIAVIMVIGLWVFYAYRFPQSSSGQFLIKYRPAQWSLKPENCEANSNAFHM